MTPVALALILLGTPQQEPPGLLTDDKDGAFDMSKYLLSRGAFMPMPIIITEPAVGYGGGLGAAFFHEPPFGDPDAEEDESLQIVPRSVSFAAGGGTEKGAWFGGAGHFQSWDDGNWRALGAVAYASANLEYFGEGSTIDLGDDPVEYSLRSSFAVLDLQRRLFGPVFAGARYLFMDTNVDFEGFTIPPGIGIPEQEFQLRSAGLGFLVGLDTRDSVMTPTRGFRVDLRPHFYDEALGGDSQFIRFDGTIAGYLPIPPFLWATRLQADFVSGESPFYMLPFVELRGVPVLRYFGKEVLSVETELEWSITPRWSILGFAGAGRAELREQDLDNGPNVYSGGAGFRYLIARRFGLKAGIDVGWSDGEGAVYIQMGTAWR